MIFVFGSNLAGRHGRGAALDALHKHGAVYGQGIGLQGSSYGIPTKDHSLRPLPLSEIRKHVADFLRFAHENPGMSFQVTAIGCGYAGYSPDEIAPLFAAGALLDNIHLPDAFYGVLSREPACADVQPSSPVAPPKQGGPHLVVADGTAILRRVYEANNKVEDDVDRAAGAIRSALYSIRRALVEHKPTHFVVAMDAGGATFRHEKYPAYKAHRKDTTQAFKCALSLFERMLREANIFVARPPGIEADDVQSAIGAKAAAKGVRCTVLSGDKDSIWMASLGVKVHHHFDKIDLDEPYCLNRFGVPAARFIDYLALNGDTEDGIPGVPKIGGKTAAKLIAQYPDVASILAAAESGDIKGASGLSLREHKGDLLVSHFLASPKLDCDIGFTNLSETKLKVDPAVVWSRLDLPTIHEQLTRDCQPITPTATAQTITSPAVRSRPTPVSA